ncbi:hypothetical protein F0562_024386 [Nyssa sinensis]|uniref:Cation/H+ exchanger transmembrane domain-containing protein n=1 Tax=Nyssa sinensis TaxID=561372 RepID=A0A5J5BBW9_9ASTE|nr:hypothetical protein F0562_024386 [Nyssa sinensis]
MVVALSITAFPVLARILAELKLLTTQLGETAMAAAAFNDVVAWILLALAIALTGNGGRWAPQEPLDVPMDSPLRRCFCCLHDGCKPAGHEMGRLIERIEDFASGLLLPLYFASTWLKTDVAKIRGPEAWGLLGAGYLDGLCRKDYRDVFCGEAMYVSDKRVVNAWSANEYQRCGEAHCSQHRQGERRLVMRILAFSYVYC